jgi:hypothetical protein
MALLPEESDPLSERELEAWQNPHLAEQIREGIKEAREGKTIDLGDFTQFCRTHLPRCS